MSSDAVQLVPATADHLRQMMDWFVDQHSCVVWGGPDFRFPFTQETFFADSRCESLPTYALTDKAGELLGFGQYYDRVGRCHLGRLVISPQHRGEGLGTRLIEMLVDLGAPVLGTAECSLFVSRTNTAAARLYLRLGFNVATYPDEKFSLPDSDYMIASCARIRANISR